MSNFFRRTITIAIAISATGIYGHHVQAQTETELLQQIEQYNQSDYAARSLADRTNQIEQVTNVKQLRDVSPTDWSYEAVRGLSDRYGCISGFPDGTYKGNQPITRNEFAAGLNSCFEQIERSFNSSGATSNDGLESVPYERDSHDAQLGALWGKIDELRSRTTSLEANQFSSTSTTNGDANSKTINWDKD